MLVLYKAVRVDQVPRRPVVLVVGIPGGVVVVEDDGIADVRRFNGLLNAGGILLELEFRFVDADDEEPVILILFVPGVEIWLRVLAVETAVGPEIEQDDLLAERLAYRDPVGVDEPGWVGDLIRPRELSFFARDALCRRLVFDDLGRFGGRLAGLIDGWLSCCLRVIRAGRVEPELDKGDGAGDQ